MQPEVWPSLLSCSHMRPISCNRKRPAAYSRKSPAACSRTRPAACSRKRPLRAVASARRVQPQVTCSFITRRFMPHRLQLNRLQFRHLPVIWASTPFTATIFSDKLTVADRSRVTRVESLPASREESAHPVLSESEDKSAKQSQTPHLAHEAEWQQLAQLTLPAQTVQAALPALQPEL